MGRSRETYSKKEVRNKKDKKRKEKEKKRLERKDQDKKTSFEDMIAWVDVNGQIIDSPPDLTNKVEIEAESIEIAVPKNTMKDDDPFINGMVGRFDHSKGFGFIKSPELRDSVFVHINDCEDEIKEGDKVSFETEKSPKGLKAVRVKLVK